MPNHQSRCSATESIQELPGNVHVVILERTMHCYMHRSRQCHVKTPQNKTLRRTDYYPAHEDNRWSDRASHDFRQGIAANNPLIYNVLSNAWHQSSCIVESPELTPPTGDVGNGRKSEIP